jgi:hypothetical protein
MRFAFIFPRKCWKMLDFWCMGPMGFQPGLIARIAASVSEAWYLLFSADNPGSCAKHVFLPSSLFSFIFLSVIYIHMWPHIPYAIRFVFVSTSSIFRSWKRTLPGMPLNEHMHFRGSDMLLVSCYSVFIKPLLCIPFPGCSFHVSNMRTWFSVWVVSETLC